MHRVRDWEEKGLLALVGSGVEPGMVDVLARYAEKYFFDEIEEIGVRDGDNFQLEGHEVGFVFSIWTSIEESLNPPMIWEKDRGWYTTPPFSEPDVFRLPEGIGDVEMVNVEHEEVVLIPRYIGKGLKKVTFKLGLKKNFIQMLKTFQSLNLDRTDIYVKVGRGKITPRDFVARVAPKPKEIGKSIQGKNAAGVWVKGKKDGIERQVYLYQIADNQECLRTLGTTAILGQTATNAAIMIELLARGIWKGRGVCGPEHFDPDPFVAFMDVYGLPGALLEMDSPYLHEFQMRKFKQPLADFGYFL